VDDLPSHRLGSVCRSSLNTIQVDRPPAGALTWVIQTSEESLEGRSRPACSKATERQHDCAVRIGIECTYLAAHQTGPIYTRSILLLDARHSTSRNVEYRAIELSLGDLLSLYAASDEYHCTVVYEVLGLQTPLHQQFRRRWPHVQPTYHIRVDVDPRCC
jgi:hypothetical protein